MGRKSWQEHRIWRQGGACQHFGKEGVSWHSWLDDADSSFILKVVWFYHAHLFTQNSANCSHLKSLSIVNAEVPLMIYRVHRDDFWRLAVISKVHSLPLGYSPNSSLKPPTRLSSPHISLTIASLQMKGDDTDLSDVSRGVSRRGRLKWVKVFIN